MKNIKIIQQHIDALAKIRILVIGDIMLDHYISGTAERISPEAPVPVILVQKEFNTLGGAANSAANARALGACTALSGLLGRVFACSDTLNKQQTDYSLDSYDENGRKLLAKCEEAGIKHRFFPFLPCTISKTRVIANRQQVVRFDREHILGRTREEEQAAELSGRLLKPLPLNQEQIKIRENQLAPFIADCDVILVSDYAKGAVDLPLMRQLVANGKPVVVDPKPENSGLYKGVALITPNRREATLMLGADPGLKISYRELAERLCEKLSCSVLLTLSEEGMYLASANAKGLYARSEAREVFDVTGAGDTVAAVMALATGAGLNMEIAMRIANLAAGIVVERIGTASVTLKELEATLNRK